MFANKIKLIILITLLFSSILCHGYDDLPEQEIIITKFKRNNSNFDDQNRKLESIAIRLSYDDTAIRTKEREQYLQKIQLAMQTAFNFYQQFVQVKIPTNEEFFIESCAGYPFTQEQIQKHNQNEGRRKIQFYIKYLPTFYKAIKNTDMMFFIQAIDAPNSFWIARAQACNFQDQDVRPIAGVVQFNTRFLTTNMSNFDFQNLVEVTIHELFHALAFSVNLFPYYYGVNKEQFSLNMNPNQKRWVAFPNVLNFVKNHFGCNEITKVYLENNGSPSAASHWERSLFQNDMMTASEVLGDNTWSGINNALMQDSGWYEVNLNFHDKIHWGKNKGCDFYNLKCNANPKPEEFCDPTDKQGPTTDFHNSGYSICTNQDPYMDSCSYLVPLNYVCYNSDNNNIKEFQQFVQAGSVFGWDSKSIKSTLQPIGQIPFKNQNISQCYPQKCVTNWYGKKSLEIFIGKDKEKLVCEKDRQILTLEGYSGELRCPSIVDFCKKQYNCEDHCNQRGFCMDQKCYCNQGFSGPSCQCESGLVYKNSICTDCLVENCSKCNNKRQCIRCDPLYLLDTQGRCRKFQQ